MPGTVLRSLADDLRARTDEQLAALVAARPDLALPVPGDLTALAQRAASPGSVAAALRDHDELTLHVALAAALAADPIRPGDLVDAVAGPLARALPVRRARAAVRAALGRLQAEALLWGPQTGLHLVGAARDLLVPSERGPRVAALDPVVAGYARDPDSLTAALAQAPRGATAALDRLLAGPVVGAVADAGRTPDPQRSPVDWLLAHHLLVPFGADRAVVPAEVVAILRGAASAEPEPACLVAPTPRAPAPDAGRVESGAVGAVLDVLHAVAELGALWTDAPPARLRSGGIAARDLTRSARAIGVPERSAALLIEVAAAAGLLGPDSHEIATVLPTPGFDAWLRDPPAERHARLLRAWRDMPRAGGDATARPLGPDLAQPGLPGLRAEVLAALAGTGGSWSDDDLLGALAWRAPRRTSPTRERAARAVLADLRTLGLLVSGVLTEAGHALLVDDATGLVSALARHLPAEVDALVLQADLTAVVPGLPTAELAGLLRLAAEPESTGAASVFRFSADSVRRYLDAGGSADDLIGALARRGSVPQPLAYLVQDVARRHADLRIGAAQTYLRCDDPVVLAGILADPGAAALGLFRLAETVLASPQPPEHVLDRLRHLGHWPQPDPGRGPARPPARRARGAPHAVEPAAGAMTPALAAAAVRAMRASERPRTGGRGAGGAGEAEAAGAGRAGARAARAAEDAEAPGPHPIPSSDPAAVVAALRAAIAEDRPVWIGYADPTGVAADRRVEPLRLSGGYLTALDLRTEAIDSFAVARITGVLPT